MSKKTADAALGQGWEQLVRQQLDRMLGAATFQQVDRLRRFLSFVVLETIAGRHDELKEYMVGIQVFGKEASFNPRSDPVVRVQARRLRARLVRVYAEEGQADDVLIDLPKGGYSPVFSRREAVVARRRSLSTSIVNRNTACVTRVRGSQSCRRSWVFLSRAAGGDHSPPDVAREPPASGLGWSGDGRAHDAATEYERGGGAHRRKCPRGRRDSPGDDAVPRRRHRRVPVVDVRRRSRQRGLRYAGARGGRGCREARIPARRTVDDRQQSSGHGEPGRVTISIFRADIT